MQAKDIPEQPIIDFIAAQHPTWCTHWQGYDNSVPFPPETPVKVMLAKLRAMTRKGLISGCGCGCRGDWRLPD